MNTEDTFELTKEDVAEMEDTIKNNILKNIGAYLSTPIPTQKCTNTDDVLRAQTESLE